MALDQNVSGRLMNLHPHASTGSGQRQSLIRVLPGWGGGQVAKI